MGEFVSDDIRRLPELGEELAISITIHHLLTIPEGVVEVPAVMHARYEVNALIINGIPPQYLTVEFRHLGGRIIHDTNGIVSWSFLRVGNRSTRKGLAVLAVEKLLLHLGGSCGCRGLSVWTAGNRCNAAGLPESAQPHGLGKGVLEIAPKVRIEIGVPRILPEDNWRHDETAALAYLGFVLIYRRRECHWFLHS